MSATNGIVMFSLILVIAFADSISGIATRMMSHPMFARLFICAVVADMSDVLVVVMD